MVTDQRFADEPFTDAPQQHEAAMLGMFIFLGSEIMLFGGIVTVLLDYRIAHPQEIIEASRRLHLWIGAANTAILLTSSLFVALTVHAARSARRRRSAALLVGSALLGCLFLGLKALEYRLEYSEGLLPGLSYPTDFATPVERLFMNIYLIATGLHAFHLLVGIAIVLVVAWRVWRSAIALPERAVAVEVTGLYWHLVDIIWVFLFPVLYLAR